MALLAWLLGWWERSTCAHRWVRARWEDGSYGLRCMTCMQPYAQTWNQLLAQPDRPPDRRRAAVAAPRPPIPRAAALKTMV